MSCLEVKKIYQNVFGIVFVENSQTPQAIIMMHSQREGLVRFIMMLLGISAATYHGKNTERAIYG